MPSPVARLLKHRTAGSHARVEQRLRLTDHDITADRLGAVLERFAGFWASAEQIVDVWADEHAHGARRLDWPRRRRLPHLQADLVLLGRPAPSVDLRVDPPPLRAPTHADVLGWLYVSEGSTLGGAVIDRTLRAVDAGRPRLRTFTPYDEGPGPMWRAYLGELDGWVGDDPVRADAVVAAAAGSFAALESWLTDASTGAAA